MSDEKAITVREAAQPLAASPGKESSPMEMIASVVQQGADPESLDRITAWAERMQKNEARRAYAQAITNFKAMCPTVARHSRGHTNTYAQLVDIDEQIRPVLAQCQLSPSWRIVKNEKDWIEVECRVTHVMDHYESTSFGGPPDRGPGRNELQARASTVTYLERYTLKALLGIVDRDMPDNDGADGAPGTPAPAPASQELMQPDPEEAAAKQKFRKVAVQKLGDGDLKGRFLHTLLANVQQASGMTDIAMCSEWMASDDVLVSPEGVVSVVTDKESQEASDDPSQPAHDDAAPDAPPTQAPPPSDRMMMCSRGHEFPESEIIPTPLFKDKPGKCPVCAEEGRVNVSIEPAK